MNDIALYGAGGLGREVACLINRINEVGKEDKWNFIGFFDDGIEPTEDYPYGSILGGIEMANSWKEPLAVVIPIGSPRIVSIIAKKLNNPNIYFPNLISPDTVFLDKDSTKMGKGNIICTGCWISCNTTMGDFNLLNNHITVGHDSKIGNFNSFMPGVRISGEVTIGNGNLWGFNSGILQQKSVGNDVTIGAGTVLLKNAKDGGTYMGVPAERYDF